MKPIRQLVLALTAILPFASAAVIDTFAKADAFLEILSQRKEDLVLTGRVQNAHRTQSLSEIVLSNESGERIELHRMPELPLPMPGDTIRAVGHAFMSKSHESVFTAEDFTPLSHGTAPDPVELPLTALNAREHHLLKIKTEGTVIEAVRDEMDARYQILLLKDGGATVPLAISLERFGDRHDLVDARIRVTGIYRNSISGIRKVTSPTIIPTDQNCFEVLSPAPADPFSAPPIESRLYLSTDDIQQMSKRSTCGEILATWGGDRAMLRTAKGQIVNLRMARDTEPPPCGASVVAAGQPETDLFRINLAAARWKYADAPVPPVTNETALSAVSAYWKTSEGPSYNGKIHGRLLTVDGDIRTLPAADDVDKRFVIDTNEHLIPVDATSNPEVLNELALGCQVRITGRCLLLTEPWHPNNAFPRTNGFAIVIRSPADVVILSRPSWWTPGRLLVLIAVLVLALAGFGVWNLLQRHLAKLKILERTRLSVELHDTLSQNLAGVAWQVAAGDNAIDDDPATAKKRIKAAERMLQSCRKELKHCLFDLRSDMLEETNFTMAILKALGPLTDESSIRIRFNAHRSDFPDPAAHAILSVIRELTANAIRHGTAANVRIAGCAEKGRLLFSVSDDGSGFDPQHCAGLAEGHFGLSGIRDRLKRLGGTVTFVSSPGHGAKATVTLPIPKSEK